jgi:hypothetical protein
MLRVTRHKIIEEITIKSNIMIIDYHTVAIKVVTVSEKSPGYLLVSDLIADLTGFARQHCQ